VTNGEARLIPAGTRVEQGGGECMWNKGQLPPSSSLAVYLSRAIQL